MIRLECTTVLYLGHSHTSPLIILIWAPLRHKQSATARGRYNHTCASTFHLGLLACGTFGSSDPYKTIFDGMCGVAIQASSSVGVRKTGVTHCLTPPCTPCPPATAPCITVQSPAIPRPCFNIDFYDCLTSPCTPPSQHPPHTRTNAASKLQSPGIEDLVVFGWWAT